MSTLQVFIRTRVTMQQVTMQQCAKLVKAKSLKMQKVWKGNVHTKKEDVTWRHIHF